MTGLLFAVLAAVTPPDADMKAVVVLTPANATPSDEQLVADVARELQLGGFTVTRSTTITQDEDGLRAELIKLADEHGAGGGVRLSPTRAQITVEVWGHENAIRKLRRRDFPAVSADERRVVALRAVELLRAVLLEVDIAAHAPPEPETSTTIQSFIAEPEPQKQTPKTSITIEPTPTPTREPERVATRPGMWRVGLGAGADKYGDASIAPAATLSAGVVVADDWLVETMLRSDLLTTHEEREAVGVDTRAFGATLGIGPLWRIDDWELGLLVSGGVTAFAIRGDATAPLIERSSTLVRPTANGSLRATYWITDHVWARLGGQAGWVRAVDVYLGNVRVAQTGPLAFACELALGFAWSG